MRKKPIVLMIRTDVTPDIETEWNHWYDNEHIPNRMDHIPGFLAARRFVALNDAPKYLTLYDLAGVDVLTSDVYLKLRDREASMPPDSFEKITPTLPNFFRGMYEQIFPDPQAYQVPNTEIVFVVGHDVPPTREAEFNAWYNTEHIPAMINVPGFATARRFVTVQDHLPPRAGIRSSGSKYITLYDLENEDVLGSEAFLRDTNSPWSSWVRSWYHRRIGFLARRIFPKP